MKKKIIVVLGIVFIMLFGSCNENSVGDNSNTDTTNPALTEGVVQQSGSKEKIQEKEHYYDIVSYESGEILYTLKERNNINKIDEIMNDFDSLESDMNIDISEYSPQYKYICYQEKTLLAGQNSDEEKTYEEVESIITYSDGDFITIEINPTAVKNMALPQEILSFTLKVPTDTNSFLNNVEQFK